MGSLSARTKKLAIRNGPRQPLQNSGLMWRQPQMHLGMAQAPVALKIGVLQLVQVEAIGEMPGLSDACAVGWDPGVLHPERPPHRSTTNVCVDTLLPMT